METLKAALFNVISITAIAFVIFKILQAWHNKKIDQQIEKKQSFQSKKSLEFSQTLAKRIELYTKKKFDVTVVSANIAAYKNKLNIGIELSFLCAPYDEIPSGGKIIFFDESPDENALSIAFDDETGPDVWPYPGHLLTLVAA